jgi:hypothetical protein
VGLNLREDFPFTRCAAGIQRHSGGIRDLKPSLAEKGRQRGLGPFEIGFVGTPEASEITHGKFNILTEVKYDIVDMICSTRPRVMRAMF